MKKIKDFIIKWSIRLVSILMCLAVASCNVALSGPLFGHGSSAAFDLGIVQWIFGAGIIYSIIRYTWELT